jgi:erythromycin esterase-like protein
MDADAWRRALATGRVAAWNLRARHMADALDALLAHLDRRVGRARVVVWEHNAHLGDARATDLARRGAVNMGQLVRARHGEDAFLVGFTTWSGTVTAASRWGGPPERKLIEPAPAGSCEALFHAVGIPRFTIDLRATGAAAAELERPRPQRAIGVLHAPPEERPYAAALRAQFDAAVHVDVTTPVEPLEADAAPDGAEPPETYPSGV